MPDLCSAAHGTHPFLCYLEPFCAADILAAAKDINEARGAKEAEAQVEGQEA